MQQFLRLTDHANASSDPKYMALVRSLYDNGSIMARDIPFAVKKTMMVNGTRFDGPLPEINWVKINDLNLTGKHSKIKKFQEQAYLTRQTIYTDNELLTDENALINEHNFSVEAYLRSFSYDFNDKFFNNHHGSGGNPESFVGIRARLDNPKDFGTLAENKMNGGGVDLTASAATAVTLGNFFELLDEMLWRLNSPEGDGVVLYLSYGLKRRIDNLARRYAGQGGFSQAQDQYGRGVSMYKNAVIRTPGLKGDQATEIITCTETAAGANGSAGFTSIYGVRYGGNDGGVAGWTKTALSAIPDDRNQPIARGTMIHWSGGIFIPDPKAVSRLYNIKYS